MIQHNQKIIIMVLVIILLIVGGVAFWVLSRSDQTDLEKNMNTDFQVSTVSGYSVITSSKYHFTFKIDQKVKYTVGQAASPMLFKAGFTLPNPDTSDQPNRDTPNKFNTSPVNFFSLQVYANTQDITLDDNDSLRAWANATLIDKIEDKIVTESIADEQYLKTNEADGIQSFAVYYYLIKPDYIYVFITNDFTNVQMREFLSGFSVESYPVEYINYQNEEMGYALSYPENWFKVAENTEAACLIAGAENCVMDSFSSVDPATVQGAYSGGFDFSVLSYEISPDIDLGQIFTADEDVPTDFYQYKEHELAEPETITVDGHEAIRYAINVLKGTEPCYIEEVLVRDGGKVYDIEAVVQDENAFDDYRTEFENIIESFQVI